MGLIAERLSKPTLNPSSHTMADEEKRSDDADADEDSGLDEETLRLVKESMERNRGAMKKLAEL